MQLDLGQLDVARLRQHLLEADYTTDEVLTRIGVSGQEGLGRNQTLPAAVALAGDMDPQAVLVRLNVLQQAVPARYVAQALPLEGMLTAGLLTRDGDVVRAAVDVRPYGSPDDNASGYLVSDLTPGLDGAPARTRPDYVLGASPASLTLAQITARTPVGRALDLGTGCGVQSLHLVRHAQQVVATDLNPRALALARLSAGLSEAPVEFREGSLFDPVAGERFDLIVSNPPYVMSPPDGQRLTYREGTLTSDGLVEQIVRQAVDHLAPGGSLQLLTNWAVTDQPWEERLAAWVEGTGLDAWFLERERLDRFAYIEMWLTDAGLLGSAAWEPAYRRWLDYFDQLGIREVGMGWVQLTAAGRSQPQLRFETWPHAVAQPVGDVYARHGQAQDAAVLETDQLRASRPVLTGVQQETLGEPGAEHPRHVVLRQRTGLLRAIEVSTVTGAVLGALDGELTVGQVVAAVAALLEQPVEQVWAETEPVLRRALREQFLLVGAGSAEHPGPAGGLG